MPAAFKWRRTAKLFAAVTLGRHPVPSALPDCCGNLPHLDDIFVPIGLIFALITIK